MTHNPIKNIRNRTNDSILLIITVILLAFAVELLAFCLVVLTNENIIILVIIGLIFIVISIAIFYIFLFSNKPIQINLRGIISYEFKNDELIPIEIYSYSFNEHFNEILNRSINNNKKYIQIFTNEEIKDIEESIEKNYKYDPTNRNNEKNIINSILEYLIIEKLSIHLADYYTKNEIDTNKIITIKTNEYNEYILEKVIIEDYFNTNSPINDNNSQDTEINELLDYFEIKLSENSKIKRNQDNYLEIQNKIFNITIIPDYKGYIEYINPILTDYDHTKDQNPFYLIEIKLHILLKRYFLFNDNYEWLDSFLNEIYEFVSIEHLNKKLNPELISIISKNK
ncbi:MAG: hypothetical protein LBM96_06240 [Methanobrevibacter sp.]|jgi:hypothetical protein|nr:hypothetical protein [Candidatus Methanoflexus mossambicus]